MLSRPQAAPLRFIALRLDLPDLALEATRPGVTEAFRLTIKYHDARHPDQIATATKMQADKSARMAVHYRRSNDVPLILSHTLDVERFRNFMASLKKIGFDKLDDASNIDWYASDLWLVERGASAFHHDMIIAPDTATGAHAEIVTLVREQLHESIRAINP